MIGVPQERRSHFPAPPLRESDAKLVPLGRGWGVRVPPENFIATEYNEPYIRQN